MTNKSLSISMLFLSLAGTLFAGYLYISKAVTNNCVLKEPCAYLFGMPTCFYGFVMFTSLFVLSVVYLGRWAEKKDRGVLLASVIVAALGILFSLSFSIKELAFTECEGGCSYSLLLPSCVYGGVFYILFFITSLLRLKRLKNI